MSCLSISELPETIELSSHPRTVIRNALQATCDRLKLGEVHLRALVQMAMDERALHNLSPAAAIVYGFRAAETMAHNLKARRRQLRMPDPDGAE